MGNINNLRPALLGLESLWIPTETLLLDLASRLCVAARQAVYNQFDLSLPQIPYGPQKGICSITFQ